MWSVQGVLLSSYSWILASVPSINVDSWTALVFPFLNFTFVVYLEIPLSLTGHRSPVRTTCVLGRPLIDEKTSPLTLVSTLPVRVLFLCLVGTEESRTRRSLTGEESVSHLWLCRVVWVINVLLRWTKRRILMKDFIRDPVTMILIPSAWLCSGVLSSWFFLFS